MRKHMAFHIIDQRRDISHRCLTAVDDEVRMFNERPGRLQFDSPSAPVDQ